MINTRLVMALEELFKKEPFDLENGKFVISANRGTIYAKEYEYTGAYGNYDELCEDLEFYSTMNYDLNDEIGYCRARYERLERKLRDNNIEFE